MIARSSAFFLAILLLAPLSPRLAVAANAPVVASANNFPIVQGATDPLGDVTVTESSPGQLPPGDVITFKFADASGAATLHFSAKPVVSGSNGLIASLSLASSSGTLNDEVQVTIGSASTGSPAVLTLAQLTADVDGSAAVGNDTVAVGDSGGVIAPVGSTVLTQDANVISSVTAKSLYGAVTAPIVQSTGNGQAAGNLTIMEPFKFFFKTGDVITFLIRDAQGSANTVGLSGAPTASGESMTVSVSGLFSSTVQPNDTGFKVNIVAQDPPNGSASTLTVSNLAYNIGGAPSGPVTVSAVVTTGASTEYIVPGRVTDAFVGGNTVTTSAGQPVIQFNKAAQAVANLTIIEIAPGTEKVNDTISLQIEESGVTYTGVPNATVTAGNIGLGAGTIDPRQKILTYTVTASSTSPSTIVIGPIYYDDVSASGAPGDPVNVLASGNASSAFTSMTVPNARLAPTATTLFTPASAPVINGGAGPAGDVVYQEVAGMQALTGGSIVLLSPYASQTAAFRTTFSAVLTATVASGSGLVLGTGSLNATPIAVVTPTGTINAAPGTAAIFPVTTGSTTPAMVTFSGIAYTLGSSVPPGSFVGYGVVDSGANGSGTSVAGNQYVDAASAAAPPPPPRTFYFAEGFTGSGFQEVLSLLMPSQSGTATIDYFTAGGGHTTATASLTAGKVTTVNVNQAVGANQQVSVKVSLPSAGVAERTLHFKFGAWYGSTDKVGVVAPASEWDFAEGSTLSFFSEYLTLQNPNANPVTATLNYFTDTGAHPVKTISLAANSRTTVEVFNGDLTSPSGNCVPNGTGANCGVGRGIGGVSVQVRSLGLPIIAERPFYVNGFSFGSGSINDGHDAFGANAPAMLWNFAEGTTLGGFNEYLTLQNPNASATTVDLKYFTDSGAQPVKTVSLPANSRVTVEVFNGSLTPNPNCTPGGGGDCGVGAGIGGVSVQVVSRSLPIVAERPMYIVHNFGTGTVRGAHVVVGATGLGQLFGFAAASTVSGDSDYLTIQNPNTLAANIIASYYTGSGVVTRSFSVAAGSRHTVEVFTSTEGAGGGFSPMGVVVASDQPVLVEKPTYSSNASTYGATDTLGYTPSSF